MFESSRLKVERAKEHISELQRVLVKLIDGNRRRIIAELDPNAGFQHISLDALNPPPMIPLIIGDAVHNLRAALDHVAGELRRDAGGDDSKGHFPISDTRKGVEQAVATHIEPFDPKVAKAILDEIDTSDARNYPISGISKLNNIDKHRRLALAVTVSGFRIGRATIGGTVLTDVEFNNHEFGLVVTGKGAPVELHEDPEPIVSVVFGGGEPFESQAVVPTLTEAREFFANVIDICERSRT